MFLVRRIYLVIYDAFCWTSKIYVQNTFEVLVSRTCCLCMVSIYKRNINANIIFENAMSLRPSRRSASSPQEFQLSLIGSSILYNILQKHSYYLKVLRLTTYRYYLSQNKNRPKHVYWSIIL